MLKHVVPHAREMGQDPLTRIVPILSLWQHDIDGLLCHRALTSIEAVHLEQQALVHLTSPLVARI